MVDKKIQNIFSLIKHFYKLGDGEVITSDDKRLLNEFDCSAKTLSRYFKELESNYPNYITIENVGKKKGYKLAKESDVLREFIKTNELEIGYLIKLAKDGKPNTLNDLSKSERLKLEKSIKFNEDIYLYKTNPFEEKISEEFQKKLSKAIKSREYINIKFLNQYNEVEELENAKVLKIIFVDDNWYVGVVRNDNDNFQFIRIKFIENIKTLKSGKYQSKSIEKHIKFLIEFQNSLTLYGVEPKEARVKASNRIAKYFKQDSKKFLSSQKFICENSDGTTEFSLKYTQPIEILPFIKRWLPDLEILEPIELKEVLKKDLQEALNLL